MTIKQYFPLSVGIFVFVLWIAGHYAVPIVPFALVVLVGETLIGFQLEDYKVAHLFGDLARAFKSNMKTRHG